MVWMFVERSSPKNESPGAGAVGRQADGDGEVRSSGPAGPTAEPEQFDSLRKMLRRELGVDPLPATIAKYEALIR